MLSPAPKLRRRRRGDSDLAAYLRRLGDGPRLLRAERDAPLRQDKGGEPSSRRAGEAPIVLACQHYSSC